MISQKSINRPYHIRAFSILQEYIQKKELKTMKQNINFLIIGVIFGWVSMRAFDQYNTQLFKRDEKATKTITTLLNEKAKLLREKNKELNKIRRQIQETPPTSYELEFKNISKKCRAIFQTLLLNDRYINKQWFAKIVLQDNTSPRFPKIETVHRALMMTKDNKNLINCFQDYRRLTILWAKFTTRALWLLAIPGLKVNIRKRCKTYMRREKKEEHKKPSIRGSDKELCNSQLFKTFYKTSL